MTSLLFAVTWLPDFLVRSLTWFRRSFKLVPCCTFQASISTCLWLCLCLSLSGAVSISGSVRVSFSTDTWSQCVWSHSVSDHWDSRPTATRDSNLQNWRHNGWYLIWIKRLDITFLSVHLELLIWLFETWRSALWYCISRRFLVSTCDWKDNKLATTT